MKEKWILTIKTSLPDVCHDEDVLKEETYTFDSFEEARLNLRHKLKEYAFQENSMFDGKGNMIYMKNYMNKVIEFETDGDEMNDWLGASIAQTVLEIFSCIFEGKDVKNDFKIGTYDDGNIEITLNADSISFRGIDCGPLNGYIPKADTNLFSMNEEKDYYIYLDDMFGQWADASSEFYLDLIKVVVE